MRLVGFISAFFYCLKGGKDAQVKDQTDKEMGICPV